MRSLKLNFSATVSTLGLKAKIFENLRLCQVNLVPRAHVPSISFPEPTCLLVSTKTMGRTAHARHVWPLCGPYREKIGCWSAYLPKQAEAMIKGEEGGGGGEGVGSGYQLRKLMQHEESFSPRSPYHASHKKEKVYLLGTKNVVKSRPLPIQRIHFSQKMPNIAQNKNFSLDNLRELSLLKTGSRWTRKKHIFPLHTTLQSTVSTGSYSIYRNRGGIYRGYIGMCRRIG